MVEEKKVTMNIVIAGHVDHGKSTVIGRLLADTNSLPEGKLDQVKLQCERTSKPFEYAFLLDALKDEQSQGITIDAARVFFKTKKRNYIIIDAPGHIEFLKNMVTGASRAEAALLVIDANEGVRENSRRHGYMLSMLGINQIAVLVNKMDLVDYSQKVFDDIEKEYREFLKDIKVEPHSFIPVSGREGDNIASLSDQTPWYKGHTVLDMVDLFEKEKSVVDKPFRLSVQDVFKFTKFGDDRRIIAGTVDTGIAKVGDSVVFYPSGKTSRIKSIEQFNADERSSIEAGQAVGFTLEEQIYVTRGEIVAKQGDPQPKVSTRIKVNLFWLGRKSMSMKRDYMLKVGTSKVPVKLEEITRVIDASNLNAEAKETIDRHDVAECVLKLNRAISFDIMEDIAKTSRFVIVDDYEIAGGGIIRESLKDQQSEIRKNVLERNYNWLTSNITALARAEKYNQKAALILVTGAPGAKKQVLCKALEEKLFSEGKFCYYLNVGNIKYGVDADIKDDQSKNGEHLRRLSEVVHIMLDAGLIMIVSAHTLSQLDLELIKTAVNPDAIETIWVGEDITTDIALDMHVPGVENIDEVVNIIKGSLQEKGVIFKPW